MNRLGVILTVLSLLAGVIVSFSVGTSEVVMTCRDDNKIYVRHHRGFPMKFTSAGLEIPPCKKFQGPRCAVAVCDNFSGLKEERSLRPAMLVADVAVWGLFAAGILYMASAFIIKT